jgi:hypothetical protein
LANWLGWLLNFAVIIGRKSYMAVLAAFFYRAKTSKTAYKPDARQTKNKHAHK